MYRRKKFSSQSKVFLLITMSKLHCEVCFFQPIIFAEKGQIVLKVEDREFMPWITSSPFLLSQILKFYQ
jgi:hypothetical protein